MKRSTGTMDPDVFFIRDPHVDQELLYLLPVVSVDHQDFLGFAVLVFGLLFVFSPLVLALLAVLGDAAVGLEVLHEAKHTFFQNLSIFL
jgi:hypothetical protein